MKVVIFDADGVLINSTPIYIKSYRDVGKKLNIRVPEVSEVRKLFGLVWDDMLCRLYGRKDEGIKEAYIEIMDELRDQIKVMDGLEYFIENFKHRKAITTSKSVFSLKSQFGNFMNFFEVIVTREETKKHKPNPEPLLFACKKLDISPKDAIYVGDSLIDYKAAKKAGIGFIGFVSGSASKEDWEELNVEYITSLKELLEKFQ